MYPHTPPMQTPRRLDRVGLVWAVYGRTLWHQLSAGGRKHSLNRFRLESPSCHGSPSCPMLALGCWRHFQAAYGLPGCPQHPCLRSRLGQVSVFSWLQGWVYAQVTYSMKERIFPRSFGLVSDSPLARDAGRRSVCVFYLCLFLFLFLLRVCFWLFFFLLFLFLVLCLFLVRLFIFILCFILLFFGNLAHMHHP